ASCNSSTCTPDAACDGCNRIGFAGVDGTTPAPCTAEGGCYPHRATFGYTPTRWRRWPGAVYNQQTPEPAVDGEDALLPAFDPPAPEDEDQQAPASISEEEEAAAEDEPSDGPAVEITLPPFEPGPIDTPRPPAAPGLRDGPPELPFGFRDGEPSGADRPFRPATARWSRPASPASTPASTEPAIRGRQPVKAMPPVRAASRDDAPPPLPGGFTEASRPGLRRLPWVDTRIDSAVVPASAAMPIAPAR
ncbi:MAG: hypothetical protein AAF805_07345, partial [Planctomycetota bacterium]